MITLLIDENLDGKRL